MKRKLIFVIAILIISNFMFSQDSFENLKLIDDDLSYLSSNSVQKQQSKFFDNFALGIKGGVNFSLLLPLERQSIFSGPNPESFEKDYETFTKNLGMQFGFIFMYDITRVLKISLQPGLHDYVYKYNNTYNWTGKTNLQYETVFAHRLRFVEVPLILGVYTTYNSWQPYFQGGAFYGRLLDANSNINVRETSSNLTNTNQTLEYKTSSNTANLYMKNHFGVLAGAGISYLTGTMRIGLEANYKLFLSDLNSTETQYMNNQIVSGNYDVPDKFKLSNLEISLNLIITMSSAKRDRGNGGAGSVFCPSY